MSQTFLCLSIPTNTDLSLVNLLDLFKTPQQREDMAAEEVLKLFDVYWFEQPIFSEKPVSRSQETSQDHKERVEERELKLPRISTLHVRSMSDLALNATVSFSSGSLSPNSVLTTPRLQTILSGKDVNEDNADVKKEKMEEAAAKPILVERRSKTRTKGSSRSLSELEFEELQGFMDLGFVFSEEDKDSSLVSIIPGLQKLGKKTEESREENIGQTVVSRPYLSEAWEVWDRRKVKNPLMNWRIPTMGNEVDMKDHLRFWAHTVASTVR
ncbi:Uncharacterized protein TCM_008922 [Theobroma cacao]|uniref:DUF1685 family protein n=1 Tax=Theobroma cacao TaxID=3641 RepID=A0A061E4F7_THECC|nr:Uncharacterized protein TCM_008922 [Theobroma cacao]